MSSAGSGRCRRRTTTSRCGRSARGCAPAPLEDVERAIAERRIVRTWLMRGTIHFAPPEDVRWLLALVGPRLSLPRRPPARADRAPRGPTGAQRRRCWRTALAGDRRLTRPEVMRLFEDAGIETTGQRGYHILVRLAQDALICLGPMQGKQQTFALLDDWAPARRSRELSREGVAGTGASRFAVSRGPGDRPGPRALGRDPGHRRAARPAAARRVSSTRTSTAPSTGSRPGSRRRATSAARAAAPTSWPASTSTSSATRIAMPFSIPARRQGRPGRQRHVPADDRGRRADRRHLGAHDAQADADDRAAAVRGDRARLAGRVMPEADRYRDFLGLPSSSPVVRTTR